ncbi:MAG: 2-C-methyl-D-erythritol 4-phosphate cytidylyltransferase [Oscillospiraceae bacterium]|nr:2-C-methyl-D-erythritol 4-phosphate cytidylyltransferase [Oscillospiraceae bacterium]
MKKTTASILRSLKRVSYKKVQCTAIIAAAGSSTRMAGIDKLFYELLDIPVLAHTLIPFEKSTFIDEIIIVSRPENVDAINDICNKYEITKVTKVIFGGETRLDSVLNGLLAISANTELVAIHDGARPCIETALIESVVESAKKRHAAAPAIPVTSTIKKVQRNSIVETIDRNELFEVQTPQVFNADLLKAALTSAKDKSLEITDDCMAVEKLGVIVSIVDGSRKNIKLTTVDDFTIAEAILNKTATFSNANKG